MAVAVFAAVATAVASDVTAADVPVWAGALTAVGDRLAVVVGRGITVDVDVSC